MYYAPMDVGTRQMLLEWETALLYNRLMGLISRILRKNRLTYAVRTATTYKTKT